MVVSVGLWSMKGIPCVSSCLELSTDTPNKRVDQVRAERVRWRIVNRFSGVERKIHNPTNIQAVYISTIRVTILTKKSTRFETTLGGSVTSEPDNLNDELKVSVREGRVPSTNIWSGWRQTSRSDRSKGGSEIPEVGSRGRGEKVLPNLGEQTQGKHGMKMEDNSCELS